MLIQGVVVTQVDLQVRSQLVASLRRTTAHLTRPWFDPVRVAAADLASVLSGGFANLSRVGGVSGWWFGLVALVVGGFWFLGLEGFPIFWVWVGLLWLLECMNLRSSLASALVSGGLLVLSWIWRGVPLLRGVWRQRGCCSLVPE